MRKIHLFSAFAVVGLCWGLAGPAAAQQKYWVSFTNKTTTHFDPYKFFDPKTIENRKLQGLPIGDWYDLPVDEAYIKKVTALVDSTGHHSRWLNGMAIYATAEETEAVKALPFVKDIAPMHLLAAVAAKDKGDNKDSADKEEKICEQIHGMQSEEFAYRHLSGKGIRIAVLDVGFQNVDKHEAFAYLRSHNGIVMTHDFLHNKDNVYNYGSHGTSVLSCIAGKYGDYFMGMAPDAEFLLARTEREATEYKDEEDAWVAAAEWAEQHGAMMISCSLGYTYQRYFYKDMNGRTSLVSRGAAAAARKGILICIAAGNEGSNLWKFISTPADADSVLTVGGYDPKTKYHISFSSFGPTSDKRIKPNVVAAGEAWVATPKNYSVEDGTSFATPLMAGFVACVWQYMRGKTNMEVLHKVETLGSLYPYADDAHGYGIPQAGWLFKARPANDTAFSISQDKQEINVKIAHSYFRDSFVSPQLLKDKYMYARITDREGNIRIYNVIKVSSEEFTLGSLTKYLFEDRLEAVGKPGNTDDGQYPDGWTLTVFFDGCIKSHKF